MHRPQACIDHRSNDEGQPPPSNEGAEGALACGGRAHCFGKPFGGLLLKASKRLCPGQQRRCIPLRETRCKGKASFKAPAALVDSQLACCWGLAYVSCRCAVRCYSARDPSRCLCCPMGTSCFAASKQLLNRGMTYATTRATWRPSCPCLSLNSSSPFSLSFPSTKW